MIRQEKAETVFSLTEGETNKKKSNGKKGFKHSLNRTPEMTVFRRVPTWCLEKAGVARVQGGRAYLDTDDTDWDFLSPWVDRVG